MYHVNALQGNHGEPESDAATIRSESSLSYTISSTEKLLNCFHNKIMFEEARFPLKRNLIIFGDKNRQLINFTDKDTFAEIVKSVINQNVVNASHCNLPTCGRRHLTMGQLQVLTAYGQPHGL